MIFKSRFSEVSKIYTFFLSKFYKKKIISRGPPVRASRTPRTTVWETLVYGIMGWGLFVCMYLCIHVCMHKCVYIYVYVCIMYVLCMHNTYICVYVCMYTNTNQIYNARNVTPKCESQARNHIYMMHVCTQ